MVTIGFYVARPRLIGLASKPGTGRKRKYAGPYARRLPAAGMVPGITAYIPELESIAKGVSCLFHVDAVGREGSLIVAHVS